MFNLDKKYLILTIILWIVVEAVTMLIFLQEWKAQGKWWPLLAFVAVLVGVVGFIAILRQALEKTSPPPPITIKVEQTTPVVPPPLTNPNTLHQIPPPPADFIGREHELDELCRAVEKDGVIICGARGLGGVGKTALALALAQRLAAAYPNAQLFLDLQGAPNQPALPTDQILAYVLHAFYPEAKLPEDPAALLGMYRSALHGKHVLLLFDNAGSAAQVENLLPPPGCLLLVTTRQLFNLPGMHSLDLEALPKAKAVKFLRKQASRVGKAADEIAEACCCLPLALRLVGGLFTTHPDWTPEDVLNKLENTATRLRLTGMEASLALSYEGLAGETQNALRRLAVFKVNFGRDAARAMLAAAGDEACEALIGDLLTASLLEFDSKEKRYRLHDLVREYAWQLAVAEERLESQERHAAFYLQTLREADDLYLQGGQVVVNGLALFDRERAHIETGQSWAAQHAGQVGKAAELCNDYPDAGVYVLTLRLHPRQKIAWLEGGLQAARALGNRGREGAHLGNLGNAYADLGEQHRAIEFYEQQLKITREIGDRRGEGNALGNLGIAYAALGEPRRAIEFYEQRMVIAREIGDRRGEGADLGNLGLAYADLGEPRRAIEFYEQQLEITRQIGNRRGEGNALGSLGLAYADLGEPRRAIKFYEQWLVIAREIGDRRGEGADLGSLGNAYADLGEPRRAIEFYEQRLVIAREIGDRRGEGNALGNLGIAYKNLGEPRRAIEFYEQQLEITRQIGDRRGEGIACWNLGLTYEKLGELQKAAVLMQVCVDFLRAIRHPDADKRAAYVEDLRRRAAG